MASVNKAHILGFIGRDPELKKIANGNSVATFSVATTENYKDKSGQKQSKTEWHNIVAWGKLADIVGKYLKKGSQVYVEGKITTRSWDKEGVKQYRTEIVANQMQMLGGQDNRNDSVSSDNSSVDTEPLPF